MNTSAALAIRVWTATSCAKRVLVSVFVLSFIMAVSTPVPCQSDLERRVQDIFLYQPHSAAGEKYNRKAKLEELGSGTEVRDILLKMLRSHAHVEAGTPEYVYLLGATTMLGEMRVKEAIDPLSRLFSDQKINVSVRAFALRSLGQIDPEANKQLLLTTLANSSADHLIRGFAAEALANTNDAQVLKVIERSSREEQNATVRRKLEEAAQKLRAKSKS